MAERAPIDVRLADLRVGTLHRKPAAVTEGIAFRYADEWLAARHAFALDPTRNCNQDNAYCDAPELEEEVGRGCAAGAGDTADPLAWLSLLGALVWLRRRGGASAAVASAVVAGLALGLPAAAQAQETDEQGTGAALSEQRSSQAGAGGS